MKECSKTPPSVKIRQQSQLTGYDCVNNMCTLSETPEYANIADCRSECNVVPTIVNVTSDYSYGYPYGANYGYGHRWSHRRR
jgi:hypothetical protein